MKPPIVTFKLDDDVPWTAIVHAIAKIGYRISNIDGFTFRVHRAPDLDNVVDLAARRDAKTDAEIRAGMKALFSPSTERP